MDKFFGFAIGYLIVDTIFAIIGIFWTIFSGIMMILWEGFSRLCIWLFNLFKRICKKLYSSFKNRKQKNKE